MSHNEYDRALKEMAIDEPNLEKAASLLEASREAGDKRASYALATWYLHGRHYRKNLRTALRLLREAAESNVPDALYDLAVCYEEGTGVAVNPSKAVELYLRAALRGEKQSAYEIGRCYYYGLGVEKDRRVARVWMNHAETLGIVE